jgi:hypothetical protein
MNKYKVIHHVSFILSKGEKEKKKKRGGDKSPSSFIRHENKTNDYVLTTKSSR